MHKKYNKARNLDKSTEDRTDAVNHGLANRILSYFPDIEAHKHGRDVVLVYNKDIGEALHKACEHDNDNEAITLSRAASIVRRDML